MIEEEWRAVPGYNGLFEVSSFGRVRRSDNQRLLAISVTVHGYAQVALNGRSKRLHRLICEAFHGPAPEGKILVLHGDGDKLNNTPDNLRWGNNSENQLDRRKHGSSGNQHKDKTHCNRDHALTPENVRVYVNRYGLKIRICILCEKIRTAAYRQRVRNRKDTR